MRIFRHFVRVGNRRVHCRTAGSGPSLLMLHQSPRSSAEYGPLMARWAPHFTCIAPDSPGFGQSDPLPGSPQIDAFAQAVIELLDALGIERTAAYGFHSGGIILMHAARRHPERFTSLALGGYAVWTPHERAVFAGAYLPPFRPSAYGEHLTWLWNRILEQSWFFPWFDARDGARLSVAHDDPSRVDAVVRDMLDSGDAYRAGYGAVLDAPRELPSGEAANIPVLIAAYDGDPLQTHIARLGDLPPNWRAQAVRTPADLEALCLAHLLRAPRRPCPAFPVSRDGGFVHVTTSGFDGLIHWRGDRKASTVRLHAPGRAAELLEAEDALLIDLPGHGLSDDLHEPIAELGDFSAVAAEAIGALGMTTSRNVVGEGLSALLAADLARRLDARGWGAVAAHIPLESDASRWAERAIPDLTPDRFGNYLGAAWGAVRAAHFFWPWFDARASNAIAFNPRDVASEALALEHRSLMRARAGRALLQALLAAGRDTLVSAAPPIVAWDTAPWARERTDVWSPN